MQRIKLQKKNSIMLTVEWFRFYVYISRQADRKYWPTEAFSDVPLFRDDNSLISHIESKNWKTFYLSRNAVFIHCAVGQCWCCYQQQEYSRELLLQFVNSLADSDCSRNTVNFKAVFVFRSLNNTFRITPSFCGASVSLLFWQREKFRQQYYKCLTQC